MNGVYVIFDSVAQEAGPLFEAPNSGVAIRNFRNLMEKVPGYQRSDYRLYTVGTYDPKTMCLISIEPEEVIFSEDKTA